jgi:hypothetical protein
VWVARAFPELGAYVRGETIAPSAGPR